MEREEAERLVERHGPAVYRLAFARTGNRADAEDVTQETFLRLVRAAPVFQSAAQMTQRKHGPRMRFIRGPYPLFGAQKNTCLSAGAAEAMSRPLR